MVGAQGLTRVRQAVGPTWLPVRRVGRTWLCLEALWCQAEVWLGVTEREGDSSQG